ncbi:MAG: hypothetical protein H0T51_16255 [Pirellulales bacterium]|nr:hypothetical protein [Pirellulales bacterium]
MIHSERNEAIDAFLKFSWPAQPFEPQNSGDDHWRRDLTAITEVKYQGQQLSEFEAAYERSLWLRTLAVHTHLERFRSYFACAHALVKSIADRDALKCFGERAELQSRTGSLKSRVPVEEAFKPVWLPEQAPLEMSSYIKLLGGTDVFGARFLWWSAVADSPSRFKYPEVFFLELLNQPVWFDSYGQDAARLTRRRFA